MARGTESNNQGPLGHQVEFKRGRSEAINEMVFMQPEGTYVPKRKSTSKEQSFEAQCTGGAYA
jgi:hypothetical protein